MQAILQHWDTIIAAIFALLAVAEVVARFTPSDKDNTVIQKIKEFLDKWVPNRATPRVPGIPEHFESTIKRVQDTDNTGN